jgi:hypothetical protein
MTFSGQFSPLDSYFDNKCSGLKIGLFKNTQHIADRMEI